MCIPYTAVSPIVSRLALLPIPEPPILNHQPHLGTDRRENWWRTTIHQTYRVVLHAGIAQARRPWIPQWSFLGCPTMSGATLGRAEGFFIQDLLGVISFRSFNKMVYCVFGCEIPVPLRNVKVFFGSFILIHYNGKFPDTHCSRMGTHPLMTHPTSWGHLSCQQKREGWDWEVVHIWRELLVTTCPQWLISGFIGGSFEDSLRQISADPELTKKT